LPSFVKKKRSGRGSRGRRRPTKPELLRKDTDAVNPEDRSASTAMDALNVDHHLFGRMLEQ
jgi:hypothetical protein